MQRASCAASRRRFGNYPSLLATAVPKIASQLDRKNRVAKRWCGVISHSTACYFDVHGSTLILSEATPSAIFTTLASLYRKGPNLCGRGVATATLVIDERERFVSAACRLKRFWKRCSVYSVVLEKVVLSRWCFVLWWTGSEKVWKRPARR